MKKLLLFGLMAGMGTLVADHHKGGEWVSMFDGKTLEGWKSSPDNPAAFSVEDGTLKVTKTENGVNPLCFNQTALLGCDVWEHSYYIDFRNKRPAYLSNFLDNLVNWDNVAARLASA